MSSAYPDGREERRVEGYTKFWQKDLTHEGEVDHKNRIDSYTDVVNGLSFLFHLYSPLTTSHRVLRRCNGAVRIRLGKVVPLFAFLQGRELVVIIGPP